MESEGNHTAWGFILLAKPDGNHEDMQEFLLCGTGGMTGRTMDAGINLSVAFFCRITDRNVHVAD